MAEHPTNRTLPRLYLARFVFAVVWAVLFGLSSSTLGALAIVLLFLYPAVDAAAAIIDGRSTRWSAALSANIAVSALAAVGLAVAGASGVPAVLRVWGVWAILAGLTQLAVGLSRRRLGGQWAMIAAGGLSVLVGVGFIVSAASAASATSVAGYAVVGGIFFLISALRLRRTAPAAVAAGSH
jgi:uncharacterized membrane protein HdeD (DUF308 family)